VAATRNGAIAAGRLKDLGTIEAGKLADLVLLDADPLAAIGNIRTVRLVMQEGRVVDRARLPERRVLSRPPAPTSPAGASGAAAAAGGDAPVAGAPPKAESRQEAGGTGRPAEYPIAAVPLTAVRLTDDFWRPRLERNRSVTIPHILRQNEITGRVDNFLKAAGRLEGPHKGQRYNDTDVYKVVEAASYALAVAPDPDLDRKLDALVAIIAAAQEPDGYLYTPRTVDPKNPAPGAGPERWSYLHTSHELYNAGHLYEAAVAHYQATGKRTLLDVALKNADLVCRTFGPGRRLDAPGHQEIELALVKLFRVTGDRRYLDQAKFFLEQRGRPHTVPPAPFEPGSRFAIYNDLAYRQDHLPVVEQTRATGHAVRATYMFAGMTDVGVLTADERYLRTLDAVWRDVVTRRMYLTGGLGSQGRTEAFGDDYVLPSRRAYAETCASIGGILWYHRMFRREGDGRYLDVLERTLYNGCLSGVSQAGDTFFYQNPLESDGSAARSVYFDVACCPANLARLMAQLPGLVYAHRDRDLFVNLFVASEATLDMAGTTLRLVQRTAYPWDGRIELQLDPARPADLVLHLRVPGWARGEAVPGDLYRYADAGGPPPALRVNGEAVTLDLDKGFARIRRRWQAGDRVVLDLPMPARRVLAHEGVADARGKAAIERGPLVYAIEAADNGGRVLDLRLPLDTPLRHEHRTDLLGGVTIVTATAARVGRSGPGQPHPLVAVPYYAWANRGKGEMAVWIPFEQGGWRAGASLGGAASTAAGRGGLDGCGALAGSLRASAGRQ
jgi:hypothetical protein